MKSKQKCFERKILYYELIGSRLEKVGHNSKDFWKITRELKGNKNTMSTQIHITEFHEYVKNLLNPIIISYQVNFAENVVVMEELDREIEILELVAVLCLLKDNKAPRPYSHTL